MYFFLKETASNKETLIYLKYFISKNEGRFVYSTKTKINPKDWSFENKMPINKRGRSDLAVIKSKLTKYTTLLDQTISNLRINNNDITKDTLKTVFDVQFNNVKAVKTTFIDSIDEMLSNKYNSKEIGTATKKKYTTLKNNLVKFGHHKNKKVNYHTFNKQVEFVENWKAFCYNELKHTDNTVGRSFGLIKTVLGYTYKKGYHKIKDYSELKSYEQDTDDIALNKEELFYYFNFDFGEKKYLERARDLFCIGSFTGQRFSDFSVFDRFDYVNGNIEKRSQKKKIKSIIPVDSNPKLKYLLEKYNWKLPKISQQKLRDYIKQGLQETKKLDYEIKKITYRGNEAIETVLKKWQMVGTHTARRTFITIALQDGWTYKEIMTVAGIKKVDTVIKYDKVNSDNLNKKARKTFS